MKLPIETVFRQHIPAEVLLVSSSVNLVPLLEAAGFDFPDDLQVNLIPGASGSVVVEIREMSAPAVDGPEDDGGSRVCLRRVA